MWVAFDKNGGFPSIFIFSFISGVICMEFERCVYGRRLLRRIMVLYTTNRLISGLEGDVAAPAVQEVARNEDMVCGGGT